MATAMALWQQLWRYGNGYGAMATVANGWQDSVGDSASNDTISSQECQEQARVVRSLPLTALPADANGWQDSGTVPGSDGKILSLTVCAAVAPVDPGPNSTISGQENQMQNKDCTLKYGVYRYEVGSTTVKWGR